MSWVLKFLDSFSLRPDQKVRLGGSNSFWLEALPGEYKVFEAFMPFAVENCFVLICNRECDELKLAEFIVERAPNDSESQRGVFAVKCSSGSFSFSGGSFHQRFEGPRYRDLVTAFEVTDPTSNRGFAWGFAKGFSGRRSKTGFDAEMKLFAKQVDSLEKLSKDSILSVLKTNANDLPLPGSVAAYLNSRDRFSLTNKDGRKMTARMSRT